MLIDVVEVQSHTFIIFVRNGITHLLLVVLIGGLIRDDSVTISLYPSGCYEDEAHIEGKVYSCTAVPIQVHRIRKLFLSPTVNTTRVIHNTTVCIKTNALTIFIPSAFYLIS
jgi:Na+-transporting NADH:ubiquinone oxidoreductase subunit NqrD